MNDKLLPCPFCRGSGQIGGHVGYRNVFCTGCSAKIEPKYSSTYRTNEQLEEAAIEAWNHRTYEVFGTDEMLRIVNFFDKLLKEIGEEV